MRYIIKQRILSWTDSYDIYDGDGQKVYTVRAKLISLTDHNLVIHDRAGIEVGRVKEKIITLLPAYEIFIDGRDYGRVQKKLTLMRPKYHINFNGWNVSGDIIGWNYEIKSGFKTIAKIHKKILSIKETYIIDVKNDDNAFMALMLVLAIDATNCEHHD